ncbi:transcriptional regulator [Photobacterium aphoticum]|uniref:Transcriptional regulator n=1 Tax=Photobacterium aphoticum TaxID=754436 RepID=A0A090QYQ0_9GAMM|nr:transcriptional regulator [Photobacterium aphoticum]
MELEEVYRRDLNLLVALKVLLEEGSVSKAAVRLNLSQSAMSRVLGRLRDLLGDPLFTRQVSACCRPNARLSSMSCLTSRWSRCVPC